MAEDLKQQWPELLGAGIMGWTQGRQFKQEHDLEKEFKSFQMEQSRNSDRRAEEEATRQREMHPIIMESAKWQKEKERIAAIKGLEDHERSQLLQAAVDNNAAAFAKRTGMPIDVVKALSYEQILQGESLQQEKIRTGASVSSSNAATRASNLQSQRLQQQIDNFPLEQGLDIFRALTGDLTPTGRASVASGIPGLPEEFAKIGNPEIWQQGNDPQAATRMQNKQQLLATTLNALRASNGKDDVHSQNAASLFNELAQESGSNIRIEAKDAATMAKDPDAEDKKFARSLQLLNILPQRDGMGNVTFISPTDQSIYSQAQYDVVEGMRGSDFAVKNANVEAAIAKLKDVVAKVAEPEEQGFQARVVTDTINLIQQGLSEYMRAHDGQLPDGYTDPALVEQVFLQYYKDTEQRRRAEGGAPTAPSGAIPSSRGAAMWGGTE